MAKQQLTAIPDGVAIKRCPPGDAGGARDEQVIFPTVEKRAAEARKLCEMDIWENQATSLLENA